MPLVMGDPSTGSPLCRSCIPGLVWSGNAVRMGQAYCVYLKAYWVYLKAYWAQ